MKSIIYIFFLVFSFGCYSNVQAKVDTMEVKRLTQQARKQARGGSYTRALVTNQRVIKLLEELHQTTVHPAIAATHSRMASCYYDLGQYNKAISTDSTALLMREQLFGKEGYATGSSYNNLASDFRKIGLYEQALAMQQLALETRLIHKGKEHVKTARCYENLAITYGFLHEYGRALEFYDEALTIYQQKLSPDDPEMAGLYNNRAIAKYRMHQYAAALDDYLLAEAIHLQQPTLDRARFAQLSYNVSNCYIQLDCLTDALNYLQRSIDIYDEISLNYHLGLGHCHENLSRIYRKQANWESAIYHANQALKIHSWEENYNVLEVASVYETLAMIALDKDELDRAIAYLDTAQIVLHNNVGSKIGSQPADLLNVELQSDLAAVYLQRYEQTNSITDLKQSLQHSLKSTTLFDKYLLYNSTEESKIISNERVLPIYERGIEVAYQLYQSEQQTHYLDTVLALIEKSKSVVLKTSLRKVRSSLAEHLPDSIARQETAFQTAISALEKQRYELKNSAVLDTLALYDLQQKIFAKQQHFYAWLDTLEQEYPKYFQLKYQTVTTDFATIQSTLTEDQTIVEYFVGAENTYALIVNKKAVFLRRWANRQPLAALCLDFQRSIYNYNPYEETDNYYASTAYALYQQLIEPIAPLLTKRVVVIPDKQMGYVPFAALVSQMPTDLSNYRTYDFLLHQYQFSYVHSAALWVDLLERETIDAEKNLLAIAPAFIDNNPIAETNSLRSQLGNLKYNVEESEVVMEHWQGELTAGQQATKTHFLQEAAKYNFLHLATHGQANNIDGDYASLAFTNHTKDHLLYLREIYNLKLNTKLLVLSACETGTGPLRKGDGIISLARGFTYAGVQSIVTTLWKINDRTSVKLMDFFYQQLAERATKDAALQQAQLRYLQQQPLHLTHPFYWAAYIPIGNMETVQPHNNFSFLSWQVGACLILLIALFFFFKERRNN